MNTATVLHHVLICQHWEESERGWGVRPDGCSLHHSEEDLRQFIKSYWGSMPDDTPDEYSRPSGDPYSAVVSKELYDKVLNSENPHGYWVFQHELRDEQVRRASADGLLTQRKE